MNTKAKLNARMAMLISGILGIGFFLGSLEALKSGHLNFALVAGLGVLVVVSIYRLFTGKFRKRSRLLAKPFPESYRNILQTHVDFYRRLGEEGKKKFEKQITIFLSEKRITGIKTDIGDYERLLVAASAVIPIFGFDEWEYDNLGEVLIYPASFNKQFEQEGGGRSILGMVGHGIMNRVMILSKDALIKGFQNSSDSRNVGIHEFVHLIDSGDGSFDGIPALMSNKYAIPWLDLMHSEIDKIKDGESDINPYGATNKVEFFAVASEYFFEHPKDMAKDHPKLYKMLSHIFNQDPKEKYGLAFRSLVGFQGKKLGRNSPCPCGSGEKYKRCCLDE